jgi:hypothetical protein
MAKNEPNYGPAMEALPEKERDFVLHYFETNNAAQAARLAGFGTPTSNAPTMSNLGNRLKHRPRIIEAMIEHLKIVVRSQGPQILGTLSEVMDDAREPAARSRVALALLERFDPTVSKVDVNVTHKFDPVKITVEWLIELKKSGWSREQLLGEFTEFELAHYEGLIAQQSPALIDVTPVDEDDLSELLRM